MNTTELKALADCPDCHGTGERDSGGTHPWGEAINIPCDCMDAQIGRRWRTDSSLKSWFPLTAELLDQLTASNEDAQGEIRALRATEAGLRERVKELEEERDRNLDSIRTNNAILQKYAGQIDRLKGNLREALKDGETLDGIRALLEQKP